MILDAKIKMGHQKCSEIRRNFDATVDGIPRWSRRVSDHDRDLLVQALADLELLYSVVHESGNMETVRAATEKPES